MWKNYCTTSSKNKAQTDIQECTEPASLQYKGPNDESPHKKASIFGYSGLVNQGATCYLNATLQTLFMTEEFRKAVLLKEKNEENKNSFSNHLRELFISLECKGKIVFAHEVTKALGIKCAHEQQDAAEYYQKILNMIEPEAVKMFQGTEKHSTVCPENHEYTEKKSFFSLAISMDSSVITSINVQNSFDARFEKMSMTGDDRMYCENCKKQTDMNVMCTISEFPDVLTLQLKRFKFDYSYNTYMKNERQAEIPLQLKVKDASGVDYQYDLYAVVNHDGSLSGGHYYAHIKSSEDQQWYEFNDSMVHRIQLDEKQLPKHIISDAAYLLFFKKHLGIIETTVLKDSLSERPQQQKKQGKERRAIQRANTWPKRDKDPPCNPLSEIVEKKEMLENVSISGTAEAPDPAQHKRVKRCVEDADVSPSQDVSPSSSQETEITHGAAPEQEIQSLKIQKLKAKIELLDIKKEYYTQKLKKLNNSQ